MLRQGGGTVRRLLLVYTGGTIGMKENPLTQALAPFDFDAIEREVPELRRFGYSIDVETLSPPVDSSEVDPAFWQRLAAIVVRHYDQYDGFVVLHGTDTMAYTASALSFMLRFLGKPVVLTGSQLPIGAIRTDGKENLLGAIEIAAAHQNGVPCVPEVSVFFDHVLMRGNRCSKFGAARFDAFRSFNYPPLAEAGITIRYHRDAIRPGGTGPLQLLSPFDTRVASLRLYPGISDGLLRAVLGVPGLRGLVLETYGAGNAPSAPWLIEQLSEFTRAGGVVVNITQCPADSVSMTTYEAGLGLAQAGVESGGDMTYEAAMTKLMLGLGMHTQPAGVLGFLSCNVAGERTC